MLNPGSIHFIQQLERYGMYLSDDIIDSVGDEGFLHEGKCHHSMRIKIIKHGNCIYKVVMADGNYIQYGLIGKGNS